MSTIRYVNALNASNVSIDADELTTVPIFLWKILHSSCGTSVCENLVKTPRAPDILRKWPKHLGRIIRIDQGSLLDTEESSMHLRFYR